MIEVRGKSNEDLQTLLLERKKHIEELRFGIERGQVKNVKELRLMRRDIARILTQLNATV